MSSFREIPAFERKRPYGKISLSAHQRVEPVLEFHTVQAPALVPVLSHARLRSGVSALLVNCTPMLPYSCFRRHWMRADSKNRRKLRTNALLEGELGRPA
jgi:hypothetical protein